MLRHAAIAFVLAGVTALAQPVPADEAATLEPPPLAASVTRLLEGPLLSDEERRLARLRHGAWTDDDLRDPVARARAMLVAGAIGDEALSNPGADVLDRAEGAALRGELEESLEALTGEGSVRAIRIRAETLESLGRFEEADAALDPLVERLSRRTIESGAELAEAVRALMVRNRLRGPERAGGAGADFRTLMQLLGRAKNDLDRLSWEARLVEAGLLWEKSNPGDAQAALVETLSLNPRSADAWRLLGEMAVASFDFDKAEAVAQRLDALAEGSPDAAIIRANGALRRKDTAGALSLLESALKRYPSHRGLLETRAAATAATFDFAGLEDLLSAYDRLNGGTDDREGSARALLAVGRSLSEARQYAEAAVYLERAAARQPNLAAPWIELGLLEMQAGRDMRAKDALEHALALDPFNLRAANSLALVEGLAQFATFQSEHFVVKCARGVDEILAAEMLPILEGIHTDVCGPSMFDHEPSRRTTIELMPDHASFAVRISGMPQIHTMAAATGPVIAMESPREGAGQRAGTYDWARTVRHEYVHTVTLSRTSNRIPHWFTEAAAVWGEGGPRPDGWWPLLVSAYEGGTMFDMSTISLRFVRPETPTDRTQAYAQGHWMYEFLVERFGVGAPLAMMDLYAQGVSESDAMREVLGESPEAFFETFKTWAGAELVRVGMLPPAGVPRATELLPDPRAATLEEVDGLLEEHPGHPELLELAVRLRIRGADGPTAAMIPLLERLAEARPVDPMPRRHLARLALGGEVEDQKDFIDHLEFLDAREQRSPAYALALAERYAEAGDLDAAWAKSRRAMMIAPFDARTREEVARVAVLRGDLDAAESQLVALTIIEPNRELHGRRLEALRAMRGP